MEEQGFIETAHDELPVQLEESDVPPSDLEPPTEWDENAHDESSYDGVEVSN